MATNRLYSDALDKPRSKVEVPINHVEYYSTLVTMIKDPATKLPDLLAFCARCKANAMQTRPRWQPTADCLEKFRTIAPPDTSFNPYFIKTNPWLHLLLCMYMDDVTGLENRASELYLTVIDPSHTEWAPGFHFIWGTFFTGVESTHNPHHPEKTISVRSSNQGFMTIWLNNNHEKIRHVGSLLKGIIGRYINCLDIHEEPSWWKTLNESTAHLYQKK